MFKAISHKKLSINNIDANFFLVIFRDSSYYNLESSGKFNKWINGKLAYYF